MSELVRFKDITDAIGSLPNDADVGDIHDMGSYQIALEDVLRAVDGVEVVRTDGDLINRNWVQGIIDSMHAILTDAISFRAVDGVDEVQTADAVQGEWKHVQSTVRNDDGYLRVRHLWECSVCDFQGEYTWNFCPNCGTRMKGGDSE